MELAEAVLAAERQKEILVKAHTDKYNCWVFQGNPNKFDVIGALRDNQIKNWQVTAHKNEIKKGDKAIIWITGAKPGCYALGTVSSEVYLGKDDDSQVKYYVGQHDSKEINRCDLTIEANLWDKPITKEDMVGNAALQNLKVGIQGTNFSATQEEFEEFFEIATKRLGPIWPVNKVVELQEISSKSGIEVEVLAKWIRAIERKGQAIIYGPPGTGKTFIAEHLANHLLGGGNGFCELVQFHPAYAYEDFIQGIRPNTNGNGTLCYSLIPGRFLDFSTRAKERSGKCVLVIDEINRANLARVFGELMYLLEYRKKDIPLAGGQRLSIPENVRLIGTMNTADRSIALVDHAMRRRFAFIQLRPQYETLIKSHESSGFPIGKLVSILKKLNGVIGDPHYEVGISFFIRKDLTEHIEDIWCMEIEPYIEEYFFDQPGKVDEFRWSNIGQEILS